MVRYPRLVLSFTQAHLCDTPFCNISRDNCAIPHKNKQARRSFAILSLQVSRDMKSIGTGPLSFGSSGNGSAKNHPWMLTTLGCPGTRVLRNSWVDEVLSWGIPEPRNPRAEIDHASRLSPRSPQPRISSAQESMALWQANVGQAPHVEASLKTAP